MSTDTCTFWNDSVLNLTNLSSSHQQKQRSLTFSAMATTSPATSNIARALTAMAESFEAKKSNPGNFWAGRESFATVAARSAPDAKPASGLPTPPNSISPTIPPQVYKTAVAAGPPTPPAVGQDDSDIDLQDAVDHANSQDAVHREVNSDAVGSITPTMLAQHHLPGVLLEHGPLAIRYIMGYLCQQVPGFSGIPPARARRIVVAALEGRSEDGEHGSLNKDIAFEKVGWGRWNARQKGQARRDQQRTESKSFEQLGSPTSTGLKIPGQRSAVEHRQETSARSVGAASCYSHRSDAGYDTPMDDGSTHDHESERASVDKYRSHWSSDITDLFLDDNIVLEGESTDVEDWESLGPEALRQGSYPSSTATKRPSRPSVNHSSSYTSRLYHTNHDRSSRGRGGPLPLHKTISKSVPQRSAMYTNFPFSNQRSGSHARKQQQELQRRVTSDKPENIRESSNADDPEAKAAVEVLLALGGGGNV